MVPCQDTPAVKHTYYAQVKQTPPNMVLLGFLSRRTCDCDVLSTQLSVPKDLVAVMSAVHDGHEMDPQDNERIIYRFRQPVRVLYSLITVITYQI